jgi:hypothetical protein
LVFFGGKRIGHFPTIYNGLPRGRRGIPETPGAVGVVEDGLRTMLLDRMEPGDTAEIALRIRAPAEAGRYTVAPKFVRERVAWFGAASSEPLQVGAEPFVEVAEVRWPTIFPAQHCKSWVPGLRRG